MNIGARFYKCDFQVHTPRDLQFKGNEYVSAIERKAYSESFIKACRTKGLDAVAITDHHDLEFFNYLRQASLDEKDARGVPVGEDSRIVVFPGMELTLDVPCQSLVLFDSSLDMSPATRTRIYAALKINNAVPEDRSKGSAPERLPFKSNNDIYDALNAHDELRNRFIVFPNVKENGGDSILRTGFHNEYAKGIFVGGYLDKGQYERHKTQLGWNNVVEGRTLAYGNRGIAILQTSDCRSDTFESLGTSSTWVKWAEPTAEGLRQACLAKESRISQEPPKAPLAVIKSIEIVGASFLKDIKVEFNDQYNVLIGGRGTGKSSILQYLSWVLAAVREEAGKVELDEFINETLSAESKVIVSVVCNNVPHTITRTLATHQLQIADGNVQETDPDSLNEIFSVDCFAQKELSQHNKDRRKQIRELMIGTIGEDHSAIERKLTENKNEIFELSERFNSLVQSERDLKGIESQVASLELQLGQARLQLEGISQTDREIINDRKLVAYESTLLERIEENTKQLKASIKSLQESKFLEDIVSVSEDSKHETEVSTIISSHNLLLSQIRGLLQSALEKQHDQSFEQGKQQLIQLHSEHETKYAEAKVRQAKFEEILVNIEQLSSRKKILESEAERLRSAIATNLNIPRSLNRAYYLRNQLHLDLWKMKDNAAKFIQATSEGALKIAMGLPESLKGIIEKFESSFKWTSGQQQRDKHLFGQFLKGAETYKILLRFWLAIYRSKIFESDLKFELEKVGLNTDAMIESDFRRIIEGLDTRKIIELSVKLPDGILELKYAKSASDIIPFSKASYGQQASAILSILLNLDSGPLIIDQPEDDLDNIVIHSITRRIISAKRKRQIIFSSHNANLAVNGDAEQILCFEYYPTTSSGGISNHGAIDHPDIKKLIKDIMEGGEIAFELRKSKYGF